MRSNLVLCLKAFTGSLLIFLIAACATVKTELYCKMPDADTEKLQRSTYQFLEAKWGKKEAACEEVSKTITYLPKYGCAIYSSPKFEKDSPCPLTTDGDYWVTFDKLTLLPREIIEISY